MEAPDANASPNEHSSDGRLIRAARLGASLAQGLARATWRLALVSAGAATVLWAVLLLPTSLEVSQLMGSGLALAVLLTPAAVLGLFYTGLRELLALPDRLATRTSATIAQSTDAARSISGNAPSGLLSRLRRIVRNVWRLRRVLLENRALLIRYGALLRFVTPGFLLLVVLAVGATVVLVVGAVVSVLFLGLWEWGLQP